MSRHPDPQELRALYRQALALGLSWGQFGRRRKRGALSRQPKPCKPAPNGRAELVKRQKKARPGPKGGNDG